MCYSSWRQLASRTWSDVLQCQGLHKVTRGLIFHWTYNLCYLCFLYVRISWHFLLMFGKGVCCLVLLGTTSSSYWAHEIDGAGNENCSRSDFRSTWRAWAIHTEFPKVWHYRFYCLLRGFYVHSALFGRSAIVCFAGFWTSQANPHEYVTAYFTCMRGLLQIVHCFTVCHYVLFSF